MSIRRIIAALRGGWLLIAAITIAAALAGLGLSILTAPRYESQTQLFVQTTTTPDSTGGLYSGGLYTQQRMTSYAQLAKTQWLAQKVVDATRLPISAEDLVNQITVVPAPDTVVLTLIVNDRDPQRAQELAGALADQLSQEIATLETPSGATAPTTTATIVQPALLPTVAVTPHTKRNIAVCALLGLAVGCSITLARAHLDTRIDTPGDITDLGVADLVGVIPFDAKHAKQPLINFATGHSRMAEAFRQVRTTLLHTDVAHPPRVIAVTGAVEHEGRTTVAINLALALGQAGATVVLVEGDLRRPRVTGYLGLADDQGLTDVLSGTSDLDDVIQSSVRHNVKVVGPGSLPPNPSEILGSPQMQSVVTDLRRQFDFVVIDAPPVLPVTDGAVLATLSDGVLIVVRQRHTTLGQLRRAMTILGRLDCTILGTVLNMAAGRTYPAHQTREGSRMNRADHPADRHGQPLADK